jgi:hypothetical protein
VVQEHVEAHTARPPEVRLLTGNSGCPHSCSRTDRGAKSGSGRAGAQPSASAPPAAALRMALSWLLICCDVRQAALSNVPSCPQAVQRYLARTDRFTSADRYPAGDAGAVPGVPFRSQSKPAARDALDKAALHMRPCTPAWFQFCTVCILFAFGARLTLTCLLLFTTLRSVLLPT